jgi:hypothetical protein
MKGKFYLILLFCILLFHSVKAKNIYTDSLMNRLKTEQLTVAEKLKVYELVIENTEANSNMIRHPIITSNT